MWGDSPIIPPSLLNYQQQHSFLDPLKIKLQMNCMRKNLRDLIPSPIKEFPSEKARPKAFQYVRKAVSWSSFVLSTLVSILDLIISISRNKELPALALGAFGLLVGWMMTVFLKRKSQEWFPNFEVSSIVFGLLIFFYLVKNISSEFTIGRQEYLSHVANGGLMQLSWLWRRIRSENQMVV